MVLPMYLQQIDDEGHVLTDGLVQTLPKGVVDMGGQDDCLHEQVRGEHVHVVTAVVSNQVHQVGLVVDRDEQSVRGQLEHSEVVLRQPGLQVHGRVVLKGTAEVLVVGHQVLIHILVIHQVEQGLPG